MASDNTSSSEIFENDDNKFKRTTSVASGIPRKLANDITQVISKNLSSN